jgi:hypothetical protein
MWSETWIRLWPRYLYYAIIHFIDSFRRFVKDIGAIMNPEYGVNISEGLPKISDYGNI